MGHSRGASCCCSYEDFVDGEWSAHFLFEYMFASYLYLFQILISHRQDHIPAVYIPSVAKHIFVVWLGPWRNQQQAPGLRTNKRNVRLSFGYIHLLSMAKMLMVI